MPKHPGGRPTKYKPEYCEAIIKYFNIDPFFVRVEVTKYKDGSIKESEKEFASPLPTLGKFAKSIGVYHDVLLDWCKKYPEFSKAYLRAKNMQMEFVVENCLRNNYQGYFGSLLMKNMFEWRDSPLIDNSTHQHTLVIENLHNLAKEKEGSLGQESRLEVIK